MVWSFLVAASICCIVGTEKDVVLGFVTQIEM